MKFKKLEGMIEYFESEKNSTNLANKNHKDFSPYEINSSYITNVQNMTGELQDRQGRATNILNH